MALDSQSRTRVETSFVFDLATSCMHNPSWRAIKIRSRFRLTGVSRPGAKMGAVSQDKQHHRSRAIPFDVAVVVVVDW